MTAVSLTLLVVWLGVSILTQFDIAPTRALKSRDIFSLLPRWSFFAPRPGTFDYHLLFRDLLADGEYSGWQEIPLSDERTVSGAIWNPEKRRRKALSDMVRSLIQVSKSMRKPTLVLSIPYLTTLNYVASRLHDPHARATQFMILRTDGFLAEGDPRLVFESELHTI